MARRHARVAAIRPIVIGIDPHKRSHTAAALDAGARPVEQLRVPATRDGYRRLRRWAARWPDRRWAIENAAGLGRPLAEWLLGDGEEVVDVPPQLAARVRLPRTGTVARPTGPTRSAPRLPPAARPSCTRRRPRAMRRPCGCSPIAATTWSAAGPRSSIGCTPCSPS